MRLSVKRNLPVRTKQLFKFFKFYRLIHTVQGDLDAGYEIHLDGPLSMFRLNQKYSFQMALFLPALLLSTRRGCPPPKSGPTKAAARLSSRTSAH